VLGGIRGKGMHELNHEAQASVRNVRGLNDVGGKRMVRNSIDQWKADIIFQLKLIKLTAPSKISTDQVNVI